MFRNLIPGIEVVAAPMFVLCLFFLIFCVTIFWVYSPKRKAKYEKYGDLPLREGYEKGRR